MWRELLPPHPSKTVPYTEGRTYWTLYQKDCTGFTLIAKPKGEEQKNFLHSLGGCISPGCTMSDIANGFTVLSRLLLFTISEEQQGGLCSSSFCWCLPFLSDLLLHICPFCLFITSLTWQQLSDNSVPETQVCLPDHSRPPTWKTKGIRVFEIFFLFYKREWT